MFTDSYDEKTASRSAKRMIRRVERALEGEPVDWAKLMRRVPEGEEWEIMDWAKKMLASLPVPLSDEADDDLTRKRRTLDRFIAEIYAWEGNPEPLIRVLRSDLLHRGQSALALLELLIDAGRDMEAWVMAKYALAMETDDKASIRAIQSEFAGVPAGWTEAVEQLAENPTREAWQSLMSFVPNDNIFFTVQHTIHLLVDLGADPNAVFEAAVADGVTSSLLELVDTGLVDPDVVVRHAERSALPSLWIALAARSAFARGDHRRCVELAARAIRMPDDRTLAALQLADLWSDLGENLREQLRTVGVEKAINRVRESLN